MYLCDNNSYLFLSLGLLGYFKLKNNLLNMKRIQVVADIGIENKTEWNQISSL